jgi:hypothetical protein
LLRKLKAVVTVGVFGACAGAALGLLVSLLSATISGPGRRLPLGGLVLDAALVGGLAGSLFAIGLILYGRLKGRVDKRLVTILGGAGGGLAFPIAVLVRDLPVSHWGVVHWIVIPAIYGYLGAQAGRLMWSVADRGEDTEEQNARDPASIRGPDVLDEAFGQAESGDRHPFPRGGHSRR